MTLATDLDVEQTWGSHQPLLQAVLEVLKPHSAIECGCGNFSTPKLRTAVDELLTIEHDQPWAQRVMKQFPHHPPKHSWIVRPVRGNNGTPLSQLPDGEAAALETFYREMRAYLKPMDFLFVDTYRCARVMAARALSSKVHYLLLHDLEPSSVIWYNWDCLDEMLKSWHKYYHRPKGFVAKVHQIPWTLLCTKEPLTDEQLLRLQGVVIRESKRLWGMEVGLDG